MSANGYLEQKHSRPVSFGAVLLLHGAAIAGVLLIKNPVFHRQPDIHPTVYEVRPEIPPPPMDEPPPQREKAVAPPISRIDVPPRVIPTPVPTIPVRNDRTFVPPGPIAGDDPAPPSGGGGGGSLPVREVVVPPKPPLPRPVIRVAAQFDSGSTLQPPYPVAEERAEREGQVQVRVTIGPDGRVASIERVSATSDAFWRATERHARSRWRFKPATEDGRPVQSSKVLTIYFRLDG